MTTASTAKTSEQPVRSDTPPLERPSRAGAVAAIIVPGAVLLAHSLLYGEWIEDDAGITFAFARSLSEGLGPVVQPGATPVEGWSNPTWLGVMVVGRQLGWFDHGTWFGLSDLVTFPKTVALLCGLAMFAAIYMLALSVSRRPVLVSVVAGSATAVVPSFVIWSTSGLENSLFALVVIGLTTILVRAGAQDALQRRRVAVWCGVVAAAAALTRPDGAIYVLAYPFVVLGLHGLRSDATWKAVGHSLGSFAVPVGAYGAWRVIRFHDWLPTTARAKQQGLPGLDAFNRPGELVAYAGWLAVLAGVVIVASALRRGDRGSRTVTIVLVPLGLAVLAYAALAPDWMGQYRFATAVWPLAAVATTLAADQVLERFPRRSRLLALSALAAVVLVSASGLVRQALAFHDDTTAPMCFVAQSVGQRVDAYADILGITNGSLLAVDGGGTSLAGRLRFVDLSGLTDARIARAWQDGDMTGLRDYVLDEVRPTFIKSARAWGGGASSGLLRDARFERDYVLLFAPEAGSGTWVRRDAVRDPARVAVVKAWAPQAYAAVEQRYLRSEAQTQWRCGSTLTPTSPSPFPLPASR